MNKYIHVKDSTDRLSKKQQRIIDSRTTEKQETVERMFGHFFPQFGSVLGVSFDGVNGFISKVNRASSVR